MCFGTVECFSFHAVSSFLGKAGRPDTTAAHHHQSQYKNSRLLLTLCKIVSTLHVVVLANSSSNSY